MTLTVLVPAHNERDNIASTSTRRKKALRSADVEFAGKPQRPHGGCGDAKFGDHPADAYYKIKSQRK